MGEGLLSRIFSSLSSKNYRFYFIGQSISLIGSWMQTLAMSWLVYRLTGSVLLLGVIGFTSQFPAFIILPFAGVLTDRFNRQRIMLIAQLAFLFQSFLLGLLVVTGTIEVWHIVVLSLLFGFITAFDAPARQSLVIELIDKPEALSNAIALNSAMFNGARLFGPAIAGLIIAWLGESTCFFLNSVSYIAIIIALLRIKTNPKMKKEEMVDFFAGFKDGAKYTFGFPPIKTLLILLAVISLFGLPYTVLLPAYATVILKGGSHTLGFLMSSSGAGAFLGAIYLASRKTVVGLGKVISLNAIVFGLGILGLAFPGNLIVSLILLFFTGFSMITSVASVNTLVQTLSDEDKRGRVMSFYSMALLGVNPIGNLLAGSVASIIGIKFTLIIEGVITIFAGLGFLKVRPGLKRYTTPVYIKKGIIKD